MNSIFQSSFFLKDSCEKILYSKLPKGLIEELDQIVNIARSDIKNPLFPLKYHTNAGENKYQISVSKNFLNDSFLLPYVIGLTKFYLDATNQSKRGLFKPVIQGYSHGDHMHSFWINFAERGSENRKHSHKGYISGVIYYKNDVRIPTKFYINDCLIEHNGELGDILIFPSKLIHSVDKMNVDGERITLSFNLELVRHPE